MEKIEYQLDLFEEVDAVGSLSRRIDDLTMSQGNLRRGLFARHNELSRKHIEMQRTIEELQVHIMRLEAMLILNK